MKANIHEIEGVIVLEQVNRNPDRRAVLRRFVGVAGVATVGTGVYWAWGTGGASVATDGVEVTLIDTRNTPRLMRRSLPGAVRVRWQDFAEPTAPRRGYLLPDHAETCRRLAAFGVRPDRPVVVVGDGIHGWGEEGRVAWMLGYLGVNDVRPVSGEEWSRIQNEFRTTRDAAPEWVPSLDDSLRRDVRTAPPGAVVFDARSRDEYLGASKFGESRGGRVPGALHLAWDRFIDPSTGSYDSAALRRHLSDIGVSQDAIIVCYCTGGVRSAYLTVRLRQAGFHRAANDDGGMWAYTATDAPLETGGE